MSDNDEIKNSSGTDSARLRARREFVSKIGKASVTAPAVALMLSAGTKRSMAGDMMGSRD